MSLNVFVTLCIVGIDFLVYFLFQWTYGDKRRAMARKLAAIRRASDRQSSGPLAVSAQVFGTSCGSDARSRPEELFQSDGFLQPTARLTRFTCLLFFSNNL